MVQAIVASLQSEADQIGLDGDLSKHVTVEDSIRQLLRCVGTNRVPDDNTGEQELLLDIEIDGARYTLMRSAPKPTQLQVSLSPREKEIVHLVSKGLPNKTIAAVLDISPWTVATHLRRVFTKLAVSSRAEMVACVLEDGLLSVDAAPVCETDG